jgi:N-acetylglucosamine transport system permease protein
VQNSIVPSSTLNRKKLSRSVFVVSFLAPATLLYALFVVFPVLQSIQISFYRWRGVSQSKTFVGLENYRKLAKDDVFGQALMHNLWLLVVVGVLAIVVGVSLAHAMQGGGRFSKLLRSVYLFPQAISLVVVAILWTFLYNPSFGLLTTGLRAVGLGKWEHPWLGDPHTALPAVAVAFLWYIAGFYIMLFSAGLRGIPAEINEAADLDGARGFRRFRTITWPMLWSIKRVAVTYVVINVMNVFALVFLMTQGGPDRKTEVMLTYLYEQAFTNNQFGYATALAVVNFAIALLLSTTVLVWFRKNPEGART